jgi:hypothetical protein
MKSLVGILIVAVICMVLYRMYLVQSLPKGDGATPQQSISTAGVKNDLLAMAQAERAYQAEHGSYASLDELRNSGSLNLPASGRDGYIYNVTTSGNTFRAMATCPVAVTQPCTSYYVDQTMEVRRVE